MFLLSVILLQVFHALCVEVTEGVESVLLSCHVNVSVSSESTVVWSREDLKFSTVHIRQQSGDDLGEQNQRYGDRTWMKEDALRTGDLSLTLRNPTVSDSESYTCTVRRFGQELSRIDVPLKVTEPPPLWPKVVFPVLLLLFVLAVVVGLVFYCKFKKMKLDPVYKLQLAKAAKGDPSVLLPCRTRVRLPLDAKVEWTHIHKDVVVHMYSNKQEQHSQQDEDYQNRTRMTENPLRTGDLSLTLDDPCPADGGLYVCTVLKGKRRVKQKVVSLGVKENPAADAGSVSGSEMFPDGHLVQPERWTRAGSTGDDVSLRRSLKSSVGVMCQDQLSNASSCAFRSSSRVHLSYRSVNEEDMNHVFYLSQSYSNSSEEECYRQPNSRFQRTHVRQQSWC